MKQQPLSEVFGYPINNFSPSARMVREKSLCPYNNRVPQCTKNSKVDPLGVCSIFEGDNPTITCPVRFRQDWAIVRDAAEFFFPRGARYLSLPEIQLKGADGKSAGNIDHIVVSLDKAGNVKDFGALEVQGVYISGNVTKPFKYYMADPQKRRDFDWRGQPNYPTADYLSSSRKRLAPQLLYKGGILKTWGKKMAVAIDEPFWSQLPKLKAVPRTKADIAWLIYRLSLDKKRNQYDLMLARAVYTEFEEALLQLTKTTAGSVAQFVSILDAKVKGKLPLSDDPDPTIDSEHDVA